MEILAQLSFYSAEYMTQTFHSRSESLFVCHVLILGARLVLPFGDSKFRFHFELSPMTLTFKLDQDSVRQT